MFDLAVTHVSALARQLQPDTSVRGKTDGAVFSADAVFCCQEQLGRLLVFQRGAFTAAENCVKM